MTTIKSKDAKTKGSIVSPVYLFTVVLLMLSGFGQMPIFKRYYIADLPGLGWLAKFYATHFIHYLCAALLLGLLAYAVSDFLLRKRKKFKITLPGYIQGIILLALVSSGIFLALKNLPGSRFSPGFIIFLDLSHLVFVFLCLFMVIYSLVLKKTWTTELQKSRPLE